MGENTQSAWYPSRPPHGGRGLKFLSKAVRVFWVKSSPSRGTWIEIAGTPEWSEKMTSSPSRGTWIEMFMPWQKKPDSCVVPLTGDVD